MLFGDDGFLYTSFTRIEAFPGLLNQKKVRVVGVLAYHKVAGSEDLYLYDSLGKFERNVFGESIRLHLDREIKRKSMDDVKRLSGRFVEVWGEYVGPNGIEDQAFVGGYLGEIKNIVRVDLAEGSTEKDVGP
jgi:hypothetical protein